MVIYSPLQVSWNIIVILLETHSCNVSERFSGPKLLLNKSSLLNLNLRSSEKRCFFQSSTDNTFLEAHLPAPSVQPRFFAEREPPSLCSSYCVSGVRCQWSPWWSKWMLPEHKNKCVCFWSSLVLGGLNAGTEKHKFTCYDPRRKLQFLLNLKTVSKQPCYLLKTGIALAFDAYKE